MAFFVHISWSLLIQQTPLGSGLGLIFYCSMLYLITFVHDRTFEVGHALLYDERSCRWPRASQTKYRCVQIQWIKIH